MAVAAPSWGPAGSLRVGWGVLEIPKSSAALELPANPQYYISAEEDFAQGATDGESIGDAQNVCPTSDSTTTTCSGQSTAADRGTWEQASDCKGSVPCWKFADSTDHFGGYGSTSIGATSDWSWLGAEPQVCHIGFAMDSALGAQLVGLFGNKTSSTAVNGLMIAVDNQSNQEGLYAAVGGAVDTAVNPSACFTAGDETDAHIVTVEIDGLGSNGFRVKWDGTTCGEATLGGYAGTPVIRAAVPYNQAGITVASEYYFVWCDTETSATAAGGTLSDRADTALTVLASKIGVTLP